MARLELRLLGRFQGRFSSGRSVELTTRKAWALLAYLALHAGQPHSREKLVSLLWSDRAEKQGRDSLRQALTALRKGLGSEGAALLTVNGDAIAIEPSAVEVDASSFEQLLAGGRPEDLERAVDLYRGDLLDGIGVRDPAFEDWMCAERERLHGRAVEALTKVLTHQAGSGAADRAMATAARLLQLDPLQEMAHRALIRLHAQRGQRGLALRQYQACVDILKRELGIAPEPETVALYDFIRQAREPLLPSKIEFAPTAEGEHADDLARAPPATGPLAERRHLTIMFVDLVGSMELSRQLDPEQMRDLLLAYQEAVAKEVARFEGHVANVMGDGVLVYFGWPHAHEDDAERATWASLAVRASVGALRRAEGDPLAVRIGIASGLVVVGEGMGHDAAVVGETPNLASRLRALASPGQIIIAESTRRLLGDIFELADLGTKSVRGIREAVHVFAVTGGRAVESRFDARSGPAPLPMVGRDQELALLLERWAQAKAGEGQGVLLVGEAGIGKSRIGRALLDAVADEPHTRIRYQCSPYHVDSALWPVTQQLGHAAGIASDDATDAKLDKLQALLARANGAADTAALVADLLGLDGATRYAPLHLTPQAQRARTLQALVGQLLGLAARQPVLVILEDTHWIDPTTLELIEQCLDQIADRRVLILLTSRPDQQPKLAAHPHLTRLTLNRLGRAGVEAIVARLGGDQLPAETTAAIIARTDGVPLFVEELTKAVLETGETSIPTSLHDSLMARLDRIPEVKEIAQIAACVGREFDFSLLAAITERAEPDLDASLEKLAAAELVFRRGTSPDATYTFKHALLQDAAYQSLLRSHRRQLHAGIAAILAERFPETEPEALAHHLTEAGLHREAAPQWYAAGQRSMRRSAYREASAHYRRGLDGSLAAQEETRLQNALGLALVPTSGPQAIDAYTRAKELAEQTGDRSELFTALWGLWMAYHYLLEPEREAGIVRELFGMVEQDQDQNHVLQAHHAAWTTGWRRAEFLSAHRHARTGLKIYEPDKHRAHADIYGGHDPGVCSRWTLGLTSWFLGFPDQAEAWLAEALALARRLEHPFTLLTAHMRYSYIHQFRHEPGPAQEHAQAAMRLCDEQGLPFNQPGLMAVDGWARTALGDPTGLAGIREGLATAEARSRRPYLFALLAQACLLAGENDEGLAATRAATAQALSGGDRFWEAETHRLHGTLLAGTDPAGAEARFMTACEVARQQKAKSLELRAATSLARLWAERGERRKALDLLTPIYGWFTEGFATKDLKDAKALLGQLA